MAQMCASRYFPNWSSLVSSTIVNIPTV